ncbi:MAG: zinc metallopeptidase [Spirochaetia bacterium]|nr:zinc metallopeptidase [Spirochaetia bacterium]
MVDIYYIILVVPTLLLSMYAQYLVTTTFAKYSKVASRKGITGRQAAEYLMYSNKINDVKIQAIQGSLTDHYDPSAKVLRLSQPVYGQTSIAAIGVAAHETGHAIQHKTGYGPLVLRSSLVPLANIGSGAGPMLAILGIILGYGLLINIGLILFGCAVLFYLVTLPVEMDASARAIKILRSSGTLNEEELAGVKKVLTAAAMTYVASALTAVANLARFILLSKRRR